MTEAKATLGKARLGKLIWAEDKQPRSEAFDDVYFSVENGLAESRYVFLESNKLKDRWLMQKHGRNWQLMLASLPNTIRRSLGTVFRLFRLHQTPAAVSNSRLFLTMFERLLNA